LNKIQLTWDESFKRIYKKKVKKRPELKDLFWKKLELFVEEPFNKSLRTHKLTGKLDGLWAFSIDYYTRLIFEFVDENQVLLVDFGSHDEVY
jgi:addiction module RelE/StbE family toxin